MKTYKIWEGLKGAKRSKHYKTFTFIGEEVGYWSDAHPTTSDRGTAYRVFRTEAGTIVIHRIRWSKWSTEYDHGSIFQYTTLEEATRDFGNVLKNASVIQ
jgi:hypothetical protein